MAFSRRLSTLFSERSRNMTYAEALAYIHGRPRFSTVTGLHRIRRLLTALDEPQKRCRCVHIGGTNGKGSTAAFTASILREAGYRTGLFTSPFLIRFEERFQIDGVPISETDLVAVTEAVKAAEDALEAQGMEPVNEFELVTAMGFLWFSQQRCDYVVLEVGLGGKSDSTNVIEDPACVCITSVSLDHMAQLGGTVAEIAAEKAGIIKNGCSVVTPSTQDPAALAVLRERCAELAAPLTLAGADRVLSCDRNGSAFVRHGVTAEIGLLGRHQIDNAANAWAICEQLHIPQDAILRGLRNARWPGRLQLLAPNVLVDCAHNEDGVASLVSSLQTLFPDRRPVLLMTMMADKAHETCIRRLTALADRLYATTLPLPRAMTPEALAAEAVCREAIPVADLETAVSMALDSLRPDELLVVCGSVYLAGAAIPILEKRGNDQ
jgi:dihydrofolate synthase/folylpolyglutamate synthase